MLIFATFHAMHSGTALIERWLLNKAGLSAV
jgi:hypothetical protein